MNHNGWPGRRRRATAASNAAPHEHEELWAKLLAARQEYNRLCTDVDELVTNAVSITDVTLLPKHIQAISEFNCEAGAALERFRNRLHDIVADSPVLTRREREILGLIASGETTRAIAKSLGISFKTAAAHRNHIQRKLRAHNAADMTRAAIRMGLVRL